MTTFEIRQGHEADDAAILELIRQSPQPGRVVLNFEREPSFYAGAAVTCEDPYVLLAVDKVKQKLAAVSNIGSRTVYINGEPKSIRYAHDLRVADDYRGSMALIRLFRHLRSLLEPKEWMQTVILSENTASLGTVGSGRAGLPTYYPCGDIVTHLIFSAPRTPLRHDLQVRQASADDLPAMQDFLDQQGPRRQFFPCYRLAKILDGSSYFRGIRISDYWLAFRGDELVGMAGVWDQKTFKQTRLIQYPGGLAWLRHLYNIWSTLFGGVHLPPAGGVIDYRSLHTVLVRDDDPQILAALIEPMARAARQQRTALVCAFFAGDPMAKALDKFYTQTLNSKHFLVSFDGNPCASLDGRIPYVEVARL